MGNSQSLFADLSPERRRLVELLRRQQEQDRGRLRALPRTPDRTTFPLSFAQQRLWFLDQFQPASSAYTLLSALQLSGPLDVLALTRALNEIVRRHESLRTTFTAVDGQPVQVIAPTLALAVPVTELSAVASQEREATIQRAILDAAQQPFDLARGPLLRVRLLRLHPQDHVLILALHHIIADGWSQGVLVRELTTLYRAFAAGHPASLPDLPIQYADFAQWQRQWLQGPVLEQQLRYWTRQLADLPALQLPTDYPRAPTTPITGARALHLLPPALLAGLTALSQREGTTLFQTLLAAFQVLLFRVTGQTDIAVGSGIAGRTRAEIEPLIGFFVNTLVLRADLGGNPSFRQVVAQIRDTTLAAYAHQDLPFEKLVEELQPERNISAAPLFQVSFVLQNTPLPTLSVPPLTVEPLDTEHVTTKLDLSLSIAETAGGLRLRMQYNAALFTAATIGRLLGHFQQLLEGIVADPGQRIGALPLLTPAEAHLILREWTATAVPVPAACFPDLFADQVARQPDASALVWGDQRLTYRELDRRANQLAHALHALGVGPEVRVGLCLARSPELIIGMLGVLKAGACYVPLDPEYPRDRLQFMLQDAQIAVLLTQAALANTLQQEPAQAIPTLCLDTDWPQIRQRSHLPPRCPALPDTAAYMIYTSGSTGRPKGVLVPQRGIGNLARVLRDTVGVNAESRVLQLASFSFDGAVAEVAGALLNGATLVLAPAATVQPGPNLARLLAEQAITTVILPPSALAVLPPTELPHLAQIIVAGEACPPEVVARWAAGRHLFNGYGPTEATVCLTLERLAGAERVLPLGRPIANTRLYVLDARGVPVPVGVMGEIYASAIGLARGYHQRPDLTAERFLPDPFSEHPGGRLYRTGDLGRWLPDGRLDFGGRVDHQVKLRGFRIELEEIAALLGQHPAVRERLVLVREDTPGNPRLVAYVTPQEDVADGSEAAQVDQWRRLYDAAYGQQASDDPRFHIAGWNSSYTGQPIPALEMAEWVEHTVDRILALRPRRVLEIGCGSGLLLFRVAPECERYVGTDFSAAAIATLRQTLSQPAYALPQVTLAQRSADDLGDLAALRFDTVVLNSVAQYFPSADYLVRVLATALEVVPAGGQIFIGDVRSLPLLDVFHTSVQLFQAPEAGSCAEVWAQVQHAIAQEAELVIDPRFWTALRAAYPQITRVAVLLKSGQAQNELTRFRYDVVLHVGGDDPPEVAPSWLDWDGAGLSLAAIRERLHDEAPARLGILNVPNARVLTGAHALARLRSAARPATVGELRDGPEPLGIDPEALRAVGEAHGYTTTLSWARGASDGRFDVLFQPRTDSAPARLPLPQAEHPPGSAYTNQPLRPQATRDLGPQLRRYLQERLPAYMVPAAVVVLDALPLTPNGKVDRTALPAPDGTRPLLDAPLVPPRTPTEELIAGVWSAVLGIQPIGVYDNFFALGGHSLLATQVITRLRQILGTDLPLRTLFEAPTIAAFAAQLRADRADTPVPLVAVPRDGTRLPLSYAQQRLWFLDQLQPGSALYMIPVVARLTGRLDRRALEHSLSAIVARHEVLRTSFAYDPDLATLEPWQEIAAPAPVALPLVVLAETADEQTVRDIVQQLIAQPVDLQHGPLCRATLVQRSDVEHLLVVTIHHSIFDGWSQSVLIGELSALYRGFVQGQPVTLPELPVQYADYALWQRQWLQGDVVEQQLRYWRQQLQGIVPLDLPTDYPRPLVSTARGAHHTFKLPAALREDLQRVSQGLGATLFMTLLAAFQVLLYRCSGQRDLAVGTPIAGRMRPELEGLIGFFVNTLVLRTDLSGQPTFAELVARVRATALDAYAQQDVPFELVVEQVQPTRDLSRAPLFQVMFILQNTPRATIDLPGLTLEPVVVEQPTAKFDLTLTLSETPDGLRGQIGYRTELFADATIARLSLHYQRLLEGIVRQPEQRIGDLPLLTESEQHAILHALNTTEQAYPREHGVHDLIAAQAARTPEAIAVICGAHRLTYGELDRRASQLAWQLRELGVAPETRVGVCLHRSLDLVVALLAVWKAGGCYVPLDPRYPADRIQHVLADAQAAVLLTETTLLGPEGPRLPAQSGITLCLDRDAAQRAQQPVSAPPTIASAANLAYVLYTSGSTGQPKGVPVSHQALSNFLHAMRAAPGLAADDVLVAVTTIAFDIAGLELWLPLLVGARIVLADRDTASDGARLAALLETSGATVLQATPATWRLLLAAGWTGSAGLRALCGGEALPWDLAQALLPRVEQLWNLYGPTETTVWSAATEVRAEDERITLGRPIANTQLYVLDGRGRPVPLGVPGELYIGGDGLARGYLNQPALTAEKFVPDAFSGTRGARLYRTGDVVRYRFDGTLEFIGRADTQVKLRGYRIELGEIEAVLRQQAGVRDAVVVAQGAGGETRLVAYVVGNREPRTKNQEEPSSRFLALGSAELRAFLAARLPEYMVPSAFVVLDAWPLTPNGKLDRKALPAPQIGNAREEAFVAPRTPTEEVIASVWAGVLGHERIGINDNFFALGGHSLLATQVVGRLRQVLGYDVPLRLLFEAPTIATFAAKLTMEQVEDVLPLVAVPRDGRSLPLSFAQQRLWFLDQLHPGSSLYAMPFAVRLVGSLDQRALAHSLNSVVARHEVLRTTFVHHQSTDTPCQVIAPPGSISLPLARLEDGMDEGVIRARIQEIAAQPFDLQQGPLLRAALFQRTPTEHMLVLVIHHAVFDGWSQSVLIQELCAFYRGFVQDDPSLELMHLPSLPLQYADYAAWQRQWLQGEVLEQQLGYWRQQLSGLAQLAVPTDHSRAPLPSNHGGHTAFLIPVAQVAQLEQLSQRLGSTLFMTCLAAFKLLLLRYSGQRDIAVGTPIAGRVRPELEGLIGFFVNTLVLRTDLGGMPSFADLIARVRSVCLAAYAHQDIPFEMLVNELEPERDLSRSPLFQVMFVLQNTPRRTIELPDLTVEALGVESTTARFDLTLTLNKTAQGLQGVIEYRAELFDAPTIERMAAYYQIVLAAGIADPGQRITEMPLLTEEDRHTMLAVWNATTTAYPQAYCLHQLIEVQAARTPDAIAVVYRQQQLTYADLNARANQLAHELRTRGVGGSPGEVLVGVCIEPSLDLVVGLLGILKAGGAYVPLDPSYPEDRIAFMVQDSRVRIILTQQHLRQRAAHLVDSTICLDHDWPLVAQHPIANPETIVDSAQLAYMIYTSGSTGAPKGVLVAHRGVINNLWWRQQTWSLTADDRMLQNFSISFDPSVTAIFWPLMAGARLVLAGPDEHADSAALARLMSEHAITVYGAPPTVHAALLEEPQLAACTSIRLVFSGGEQLPTDLQHRFFERLSATLCNVYGPTEATIETTFWVCTQAAAQTVPIGRPIPNVQAYLLDSQLQPVPVGVPGELYIGGEGLAWGYYHRPDLTAERFIPHPFVGEHPTQGANVPGARLYRTGDLARYRADGAIEFVGRIDHQIKLRGARIELGEIEAALRQHPQVHDAAAIIYAEPSGNQRLISYIVARPGATAHSSDLRAFMDKRLPKYMVPSAFMVLDALPLTPNGKIDRQALPPFDVEQLNAQRIYTAPRDVLEVQLVRIWEAVLQQHPIGVIDHFFERGGNSLIAVRLSAQIEQQLGQKLPLATIFAHPTIRELATMLWERGWPGVLRKVDDLPLVKSPLVAIQPHGSRPPFFFVAPLGGVLPSNILCGLLDIMPYFGLDQPYYGVQLPGLAQELVPYLDGEHMLDPVQLQSLARNWSPDDQRIQAAAAECIAAIRVVQPAGPYLLGGFCTGTTIAFEMACQLQQQGEAVSLLALVDPPLSLRRKQGGLGIEQRSETQNQDIARFLAQLNHPDPDQVAWFINRDLGGGWLPTDLTEMMARLRELDVDDWWRYGAEQLAQTDGVMRGVDHQELRRLFMIYRLNTLSLSYVLRHYEPPVYSGPMTVVQAERMYNQTDDVAAHWQQLTTQPVEIQMVPGDHGTIFQEPNVQVLMQILLDCIGQAGELAGTGTSE